MNKIEAEMVYKAGEKVWIMYRNRPREMTIHHIEVLVYEKSNSVIYKFEHICGPTGLFDVPEEAIYASKEQLIVSL